MNPIYRRPVKNFRIIGQFACLLASFSASGANLEVHLDNLQAPGTVYAALHAGPTVSWTSKPVALASSDSSQLLFENLPPGDYALQLFQDTNSNRTLDLSRRGIPLEPVGLSGNPPAGRGRPPASDCLFTLDEQGSLIRIQLVQPSASRRSALQQ